MYFRFIYRIVFIPTRPCSPTVVTPTKDRYRLCFPLSFYDYDYDDNNDGRWPTMTDLGDDVFDNMDCFEPESDTNVFSYSPISCMLQNWNQWFCPNAKSVWLVWRRIFVAAAKRRDMGENADMGETASAPPEHKLLLRSYSAWRRNLRNGRHRRFMCRDIGWIWGKEGSTDSNKSVGTRPLPRLPLQPFGLNVSCPDIYDHGY